MNTRGAPGTKSIAGAPRAPLERTQHMNGKSTRGDRRVRVGEVCAGYGGLLLGVSLLLPGAELAWYAENDRHASWRKGDGLRNHRRHRPAPFGVAGLPGVVGHLLRRPDGRLSPLFVEWMMGLPAGWVTGVPGVSRTQQRRIFGNGVVPQQAALALTSLHLTTPRLLRSLSCR